MNARHAFSLFAALVLLSPLAAVALPACAPDQHCPMAGAVGEAAPCHGTAIQTDDCCLSAAAVELAEVAPVIGLTAPAADHGTQAPGAQRAGESPLSTPDSAPSTPLYRLFRALLI